MDEMDEIDKLFRNKLNQILDAEVQKRVERQIQTLQTCVSNILSEFNESTNELTQAINKFGEIATQLRMDVKKLFALIQTKKASEKDKSKRLIV